MPLIVSLFGAVFTAGFTLGYVTRAVISYHRRQPAQRRGLLYRVAVAASGRPNTRPASQPRESMEICGWSRPRTRIGK